MRKRSEYKGEDNRRKPSKERQVTVGESNTLLPFLFELLKEQSRSSVKGLLSRGQISVNGKVTRHFDAPLNPNDTVVETCYQVRLFDRQGNKISLTEAGKLLQEHSEKILEDYKQLEYEMHLLHNEYIGDLKLGASTNFSVASGVVQV